MSRYIGLMSGTSADSIDAALVDFSSDGCRLIGTVSHPLPSRLKARIHALTLSGDDEIERMASLDQELGEAFADATLALLAETATPAQQVTAIGSHGQTVRHQAARDGGTRYSLQIGNPHLIAERTGILTIADFRRRDIACGGQGAPLAPAFHRAQFASPGTSRCIVNIGGMSNVTCISRDGAVIGFDTGPGNTLMDAWIQHWRGEDYDADGRWAASGAVSSELLKGMMQHPFIAAAPPKSTGREDFNLPWLQAQLDQLSQPLDPVAVQATLAEFTAISIAEAIRCYCAAGAEVFVCGGGAYNRHLLHRLQEAVPDMSVATTLRLGLAPDWVEATAFAWLAKQHIEGKPGNLPSVTGATKAVVLGAAYPA